MERDRQSDKHKTDGDKAREIKRKSSRDGGGVGGGKRSRKLRWKERDLQPCPGGESPGHGLVLFQAQPHLELIPGVRVEAISTAASQMQVGATKSLLRTSPANEAATVIIPGGRCLCVTEPFSISRIVGGGGKQRPG